MGYCDSKFIFFPTSDSKIDGPETEYMYDQFIPGLGQEVDQSVTIFGTSCLEYSAKGALGSSSHGIGFEKAGS